MTQEPWYQHGHNLYYATIGEFEYSVCAGPMGWCASYRQLGSPDWTRIGYYQTDKEAFIACEDAAQRLNHGHTSSQNNHTP